MLDSRRSALGCLSRASCTSSSCFLQSVSQVLCSLKFVVAKKGRVWRRVMVAFHARARHRYVIEYVSLLANTISHIATRRCYTVFSPCSAIRQRVYCKSDKRWGVSTRCGQTNVVHHQCIHSTLMHNALVHLLPRIHCAQHTGKRCTFRRLRYLLCGKNAL